MTVLDQRSHPDHTPTLPRREAHRQELAQLLDRDPATLPDTAMLRDDPGLDSLAMMSVLSWLETRGVLIDTERDPPASVGEVLSLLDKAALPGLHIRVTDGHDSRPIGPADVPTQVKQPDPLTPVLATRTLQLTPIQPDDIGFLYSLAAHPQTSFRWRYRGAPPAFDRFVADLWTHVLVQYVVRRTRDNQPVGLVVAYGPDDSLSHAYVGAVFQPQHTGTGLAAQAATIFVRHLFHTFRLRKLYLEIAGFNWPQMQSGEGRLFQIEGILRGHYYYAGRYWDKYIGAIYPEQATEDSP
jgi:RimJ/RimL family protein N-acetyltransferase/aryl carrier-like protein